MTKAIVAGTAPIAVEVKAGENYFWCSCGQSKKQPFCDGSHKGSEFTPVEVDRRHRQDGLFLRLQADRQLPDVRRQPQDRLSR